MVGPVKAGGRIGSPMLLQRVFSDCTHGVFSSLQVEVAGNPNLECRSSHPGIEVGAV